MAELGKTNELLVLKQVDFGFYLEGDELGEILLPIRYAPPGLEVDTLLEVFLYLDSEDRVIATTEVPLAEIGEIAHLEAVQIGDFGAFLHWGLMKDLLVPFKEQRVPMVVGKSYSVFVFLDKSGRIAASSKLDAFLYETDENDFSAGEEVHLHIASRSELGYKAVIEGSHLGLIHHNDIFRPIEIGQQMMGYIKQIRPDGRITLALSPPGRAVLDGLSERILSHLHAQGGSTTLTDKSPPEAIYQAFHTSKANYKKALGKLFKEKRIRIESDAVRLAGS